MKRVLSVLILSLAAFVVLSGFSCTKASKGPALNRVAVFVPGVASGSPIYEMLVAGAQKAVAEREGASIKVIEAGYDQSTWLDKLRDIAASGEFNLIVSSNPSLPELCAKVAADFPAMRFLLADAYLVGNPAIHTILYNQTEQAYLVGCLAGLYTKQAGGVLKAGLIAAQRYPTLDRLIQPGFEAGLKAVDPAFTLEYREIGNWYDATKAAELARSIYESGAKVILPIAGGAGQGVISAAAEAGAKVVWFDGSGYDLAPGTVIGCALLAQDVLVYERLKAVLEGDKPWGRADIVGARDGYIDFDLSGQAYKDLDLAVRSSLESAIESLKKGQPDFTLTSF